MTKDELRKHCERICARYAEANRVTTCLTYEEHKLVLDLLNTDDVLTKALVLKALEDVRAEIETDRKDSCRTDYGEGVQNELNKVVEIIDRKIKECKHET